MPIEAHFSTAPENISPPKPSCCVQQQQHPSRGFPGGFSPLFMSYFPGPIITSSLKHLVSLFNQRPLIVRDPILSFLFVVGDSWGFPLVSRLPPATFHPFPVGFFCCAPFFSHFGSDTFISAISFTKRARLSALSPGKQKKTLSFSSPTRIMVGAKMWESTMQCARYLLLLHYFSFFLICQFLVMFWIYQLT